MADVNKERRRSPRFTVQTNTLSVMTTDRAHVLDISRGGVLLLVPNPPSDSLVLRMSVGGGRFSSILEVRHRSADAGGIAHVGAAFVGMNAESRRTLESFLRHATPRKHQVHES